jgi:uncharacterized protein YbjT (DUF2867 family)
MFGPGEHSAYAREVRNAAVSRVVFPGAFRGRRFSFVHVADVAGAAIHLLRRDGHAGQIFNVAAPRPLLYEEGFRAYRRALGRLGRRALREKLLAAVSCAVQRVPGLASLLARIAGGRVAFTMWREGYAATYSSRKLLETGFRFRWTDFEEVLIGCDEEAGIAPWASGGSTP